MDYIPPPCIDEGGEESHCYPVPNQNRVRFPILGSSWSCCGVGRIVVLCSDQEELVAGDNYMGLCNRPITLVLGCWAATWIGLNPQYHLPSANSLINTKRQAPGANLGVYKAQEDKSTSQIRFSHIPGGH